MYLLYIGALTIYNTGIGIYLYLYWVWVIEYVDQPAQLDYD